MQGHAKHICLGGLSERHHLLRVEVPHHPVCRGASDLSFAWLRLNPRHVPLIPISWFGTFQVVPEPCAHQFLEPHGSLTQSAFMDPWLSSSCSAGNKRKRRIHRRPSPPLKPVHDARFPCVYLVDLYYAPPETCQAIHTPSKKGGGVCSNG